MYIFETKGILSIVYMFENHNSSIFFVKYFVYKIEPIIRKLVVYRGFK
jgi:hypothetical protein